MRGSRILLSEAIDQYIKHLRAKRRSDNTTKNVEYLLRGALALWGNIHTSSIGPKHVDRLFADREWSAATINTNLGYLKTFFAWCRNQGYISLHSDPCFGWTNQVVPNSDSLRLPVEEFGLLLDALDHPRDRAQIAAGLFLFLRGGEITELRVGSIDFARHEIRVYREKTKDEDRMPMCSELEHELRVYLNWYRHKHGILRDEWFLFPARVKVNWTFAGPGRCLPPTEPPALQPAKKQSHPYRVAKRALAKLGYPVKGEGEHTLRRSGARAYCDSLRAQGVDNALLKTAAMLGHKDVRQTQRYIGLNIERLQRNESLAGKPMFGDIINTRGTVIPLEAVNG